MASTPYQILRETLRASPRTWLITGVAGFIGSHLLEHLLLLGQRVVGLDNLSTGSPLNLEDVRSRVPGEAWERFEMHEGTVADIAACRLAARDVDVVLHEAGFISVPLSVEDPAACHETNVTGTLNLLIAARDRGVKRFVYASSSAIYGDDPRMPKAEDHHGAPISPYGASKLMDELYAGLFTRYYGMQTVGLRYFNVFGPRQNPKGGYAAVIPQWIQTLLEGGDCRIHGDGLNTRDFCHAANVVQANLLAGAGDFRSDAGAAFNVALGGATSLNELYALLCEKLEKCVPGFEPRPVIYGPAREGDIRHSSADISQIRARLGYDPEVTVNDGLDETVQWYASRLSSAEAKP